MTAKQRVVVWLLMVWIAGLGHAIDLGQLLRRNENSDNNKSMKRRLSEMADPHSNVLHGHDAATGTVVPPELSEHYGMNACDSRMAKSVVALTEQRDKAVNELRQVTLDLQSTRTTLKSVVSNLEKELNKTREEAQSTISKLQQDTTAKLSKMEQDVHGANERSEKEIAEARATFEAASAKLTKEANETMQAIHQSSNENINRIQQERDRRIAEMQETISELQSIRQLESEQLMQESELTVASLRAEALKNLSDVQIKAENEISKIKMESAKTISQLRLELSSTKADAVATLQNLQEEAFRNASVIMEEANQKIAAVEKDRGGSISRLKQLLNATKVKAVSELSALREEANKEIDKAKADAAHELTQVKQEHDKSISSLNKKVAKLKKKIADLEANSRYLATSQQEAMESVSRWEKLFSERTYCNLTHVQEDTRAALSHASRIASEKMSLATEKVVHLSRRAADHAAVHLTVASEHVARVVRDLAQKASVASAPHVQKARLLYDQHLKQHVDKLRQHHEKYVLPLYQKYVVPSIPVAVMCATKARDKAQILANRAFVALVAGFKRSCPIVVKQLRKLERQSKFFNGFSAPVKQGCKNPEHAVYSLLTALLVIFIVIFRVTFWRLGKRIILMPIRIVWFVNPLRLLKRKKTKKPEPKTNGVAGGKNKNKVE